MMCGAVRVSHVAIVVQYIVERSGGVVVVVGGGLVGNAIRQEFS